MIVSPATPEQVPALARLVNAAYAAGEAGLWVDGLERTDEAEIAAAVDAGEMLVATVDGRTAGCARVRALDETTGEVGLVSVEPGAWGGGAGRALLDAAEDRMRSLGARAMKLTLLVPRDSEHPFKERLREWYTRLGYEVTGVVPFEDVVPHAAPSLAVPCDLLLFHKRLNDRGQTPWKGDPEAALDVPRLLPDEQPRAPDDRDSAREPRRGHAASARRVRPDIQ